MFSNLSIFITEWCDHKARADILCLSSYDNRFLNVEDKGQIVEDCVQGELVRSLTNVKQGFIKDVLSKEPGR